MFSIGMALTLFRGLERLSALAQNSYFPPCLNSRPTRWKSRTHYLKSRPPCLKSRPTIFGQKFWQPPENGDRPSWKRDLPLWNRDYPAWNRNFVLLTRGQIPNEGLIFEQWPFGYLNRIIILRNAMSKLNHPILTIWCHNFWQAFYLPEI